MSFSLGCLTALGTRSQLQFRASSYVAVLNLVARGAGKGTCSIDPRNKTSGKIVGLGHDEAVDLLREIGRGPLFSFSRVERKLTWMSVFASTAGLSGNE